MHIQRNIKIKIVLIGIILNRCSQHYKKLDIWSIAMVQGDPRVLLNVEVRIIEIDT